MRIGPYETLSEIGRGGFGTVYRARREDEARDVALKVLRHPGGGPDPEDVRRFRREIELLRTLDHPGIVRVLDAAREDETPFWVALDLIEGESLAARLAAETLPWREAVAIVRDVADALGHAHARGILHRDVKPENILLGRKVGGNRSAKRDAGGSGAERRDRGEVESAEPPPARSAPAAADASGVPAPDPQVGERAPEGAYLTDFGLARRIATGSKLTRTGFTVGTPEYMSPEQARGETGSLTPAADVWGLGCVLYEALAGRTPFGDVAGAGSPDVATLVGAILSREPTPIRRLRPDLPPALARVLAAALAKDPRRRYGDAWALRDDLEQVLRGKRPRAPRPPAPRLLTGALVLAAAFVTAGLLARGVADRSRAAPAAGDPALSAAGRARALRESAPAEAVRLLAQALECAPARHDWRLERGRLLWGLGDEAGARAEWGRVPEGVPEAAAARLDEALIVFFRLEDPAARREAVPRLEAVAQGGGPEAALARGALSIERGAWPEARETLRSREGWQASILRAYVEEFDPAGDRAAAARHYAEALRGGIPLAWAHHNRGYLLYEQRDYRGAMEALDAALRIRPSLPQSLCYRGLSRSKLGDDAGAVRDLDAAIGAKPDYARALAGRAEARRSLGDARGALEDLDAAVRARPGDAAALRLRAQLRHQQGDLAGADRDLTDAMRADPGHPDTLYRRGKLRADRGDREGALADLDAAILARPRDAAALGVRGVLRRAGGDLRGALGDLEAAHAEDPDSAEHLANLAFVRRDLGDPDGAVRDLTEALRRVPDDPVLLTNRGNAHLERRDLEAAERDHRAALRAKPDFAEGHANLGNLLEEREDWMGAAAEFREFLRLAPAHPAAAQFRARLAACEESGKAAGGRK